MNRPSPDQMIRIVSKDGQLRGVAADTSSLVEEICALQQCDPTGSVALGRLLSGATLLGALLKDGQRLALAIEGNGTMERLCAETDATGYVRATARHPQAALPPRDGRFDVPGAIGRAGFLTVTRDLGLKEPYRGTVQLYTSEVAEDIAYYLTISEQVPSCVALGVGLDEEGRVASAGGFLIQAMPPGDEATLLRLEERLGTLPPVSQLLRDGTTPRGILEQVFAEIPFEVVSESWPRFRCSCSRQQVARIARQLLEKDPLGPDEPRLEVCCEFCRQCYSFSSEELLDPAGR